MNSIVIKKKSNVSMYEPCTIIAIKDGQLLTQRVLR